MRIAHPGQGRAVVGDDVVGAEVAHQRLVATAAHPGDRGRAEVAGQLDRGHADRAGGPDDQDPTSDDVGLVAQVVQGRGAAEEHRGGVEVAHRGGDLDAAPDGHGGQLGVGAHPRPGHRGHSGARGGALRAAALDRPGQGHAQDGSARTAQTEGEPRGQAEARWEARPADAGVAGVDRRGAHAHQGVAVAQPRLLDVAHLDHLGRTVGPHHRSSHDHSPYTCKTLCDGC